MHAHTFTPAHTQSQTHASVHSNTMFLHWYYGCNYTELIRPICLSSPPKCLNIQNSVACEVQCKPSIYYRKKFKLILLNVHRMDIGFHFILRPLFSNSNDTFLVYCSPVFILCCVCVCVLVFKALFPLPSISPDRSMVFADTQHFIIKPFGWEQIRTLYRYAEETNSSLISTSLYQDHSLRSMTAWEHAWTYICIMSHMLSLSPFFGRLDELFTNTTLQGLFSVGPSGPIGRICALSQLFPSQKHCVFGI